VGRGIGKLLLGYLLIPLLIFASSLPEKYPLYRYVFSEFDVDESYIDSDTFNRFVHENEKSVHALYRDAMKRANGLVPMMKGYLEERGLSDLFIYLSMVESGFSTTVVSSKKAVGLWQFMPQTALHYNLEVCHGFDERCDPVSSTHAAISYLEKLHKEFGKWYLAAIAYNCGEGRLKHAIKEARSDTLEVLSDAHNQYLPEETRNYIRKILLIAMMGEGEYMDFPAVPLSDEGVLMQVEVSGGCDLKKLAQTIAMPVHTLLDLNRQFNNGVVPKEKAHYTITLPEERMMRFYLSYQTEEKHSLSQPYLVSHVVQIGETVEELARMYHTSAKEIEALNYLEDPYLEVGSILLVPVDREAFEKLLRTRD